MVGIGGEHLARRRRERTTHLGVDPEAGQCGGGTDGVARLIGDQLSGQLGTNVNVVNRTGGSGVVDGGGRAVPAVGGASRAAEGAEDRSADQAEAEDAHGDAGMRCGHPASVPQRCEEAV